MRNYIFNIFRKSSIEDFGIKIFDGEQCVILGNGPSLKETLADEKKFKFINERKKFGVNNCVLTQEFQILKHEYLVFMDPYYWDKTVIDPCLSKYKKMAEILSKVDWNIVIFLPKAAKNWNFFIKIPDINRNVQIKYINTNSKSKGISEKRLFKMYKINKKMPRVQNVLVACIYLAINIGFEKSYLFGADHSWHENLMVGEDNIPKVCDIHYFEDKKNARIVPFYKDGECKKTFDMAELFYAFSCHFKAYKQLEGYANHMKVKIYNASEKSYIDAFERIKINV